MKAELAETRRIALRFVGFLCYPFSIIRKCLTFIIIAIMHKMALICIYNGDYAYAERAYKAIIYVNPRDRRATFQLAHIYLVFLSLIDEAKKTLDNWLVLEPDDIEAHILLVEINSQKNEITKAKEHLEEITSRIGPDSPIVNLASGVLYRWNGKLEESSELIWSALKKQDTSGGLGLSDEGWALSLIAHNLIDQGKQGDAVTILEKGVELCPDTPQFYYLLARCRYYTDPLHPHINYMNKRIEQGNLSIKQQTGFHFALGEALDSMGQCDAAFPHFKAGNDFEFVRSNFKLSEFVKSIDQQIELFTQEFFSTAAQRALPDNVCESPIFILGMPRSGTTLTEQILASHSTVRPGGERNDGAVLVEHLCSSLKEPYPSCVKHLDGKMIDNLVSMYLTRVSSLLEGGKRLVEKSISNWFVFALIAILFPRAKFVQCQRNPLDTCLSCYLTNLPETAFTCDLKVLGLFHRQYERLMSHWKSICPGRIFEMQYEKLVAEPESQIRKLLAYCELPWEDSCLNPQQTTRVVNTASASQVKKPINSGSVGRWKRYEKHIQPLVEALDGV